MALTTWNPFQHWQDFDDLFGRVGALRGNEGNARPQQWAPRVDIAERDDAFELHAELPGVKREDMNLSVDGDVLTISGNRESRHEEEGKNAHRIERVYGSFSRSFTLPENVDKEAIDAKYNDGVLEVTVPKKAADEPKAIEVKIG